MPFSLKRMIAGDDPLFIAPDVFDDPVDAGRLAAYLHEPGHRMVLAFEDGLVVGQRAPVLHRHPDRGTELHIDEVGTASTHRRKGIGRAMPGELFARGREFGSDKASLGTGFHNVEANGLYQGLQPIEDDGI